MHLKQEIKISLTYPLTTSSTIGYQTANLQYGAIDQVGKLLQRFIDQSVNSKEKLPDINRSSNFILPRQNNTIYINGERGAGKTTFLLDILEKYRAETNVSEKIIPIAFIDPTLVQTNQAILVDIISKMYQKTNEVLICGKDHEKKSKLNTALEHMSDGLKLLEFNHNTPPQKDSSWYLEKSLKNSTSGQCLEQKFHDFIDTCAEILNANLFILAIDDVDTKTDKAFEVLEVIRRYLTHPKLSILISGDLQLYSHLVKNQKLKEISFENAENHNSEMVEHLEQQYLAKIFPLEQRVILEKMTDVINTRAVLIEYERGNNKILQNIETLLSDIIHQALGISQNHLESYQKFIFNQPIRSIFQFLKYLLDSSSFDDEKFIIKPISLKIALYNIFFGSMISEKLKLINLTSYLPEIPTIGYELFKLLEKNDDLETGFYCRPENNLDYIGHSAGQFYLATIISNQLQASSSKISDFFKIMFATGASASIYSTYVENSLKEEDDYLSYLNYIGLSRNEAIVSLVAHFSPIIMHDYSNDSAKKQVGTISGVIRTPRKINTNIFDSDLFKSKVSFPRIGTIDTLSKGDKKFDSFEEYLALQTVLLSSHSAITATEGRDYISIYSLLAGIAELLELSSDQEELGSSLNIKFSKLSTLQSYSYPNFFKRGATGDDDISDDSDQIDQLMSEDGDQEFETKFFTYVENWIKNINQVDITSSPLMIGKIWTRIFQSCTKISEDSKKEKSILLEELLSRLVWTIINSILIEECRYSSTIPLKYKQSISKARNTNMSPKELDSNLKDLISATPNDELNNNFFGMKKLVPLTYSLLSCPLLWPYLTSCTSLVNDTERITQEKKSFRETLESIFNEQDDYITYIKYLEREMEGDQNNKSCLYISSLPIMGTFRK